MSSGGLGGLNKSPNGVVLGLVQLQLPIIKTTGDVVKQTTRICEMVCTATAVLLSTLLVYCSIISLSTV